MIEVEAVALETPLQALNSACYLLNELCESGEGDSEAGRERDATEARHRGLMEEIGRMKENLNAELSEYVHVQYVCIYMCMYKMYMYIHTMFGTFIVHAHVLYNGQ